MPIIALDYLATEVEMVIFLCPICGESFYIYKLIESESQQVRCPFCASESNTQVAKQAGFNLLKSVSDKLTALELEVKSLKEKSK